MPTPIPTQKENEISVVETPKILNDQEQFLKDNGFKIDAEFSDNQFKEFKKAINTGLFKKESFCEVFRKALKLEGNDLKKYLKKFKKIEYFETLLFFYGPKVCDAKAEETYAENTYSTYINTDDNVSPCEMSKDFIKKDLHYPNSADFSMIDCSVENNSDGSYTILRKVSAQNAFGVESSFVYKLTIGYKGGEWTDLNNWELLNMRSEEMK